MTLLILSGLSQKFSPFLSEIDEEKRGLTASPSANLLAKSLIRSKFSRDLFGGDVGLEPQTPYMRIKLRTRHLLGTAVKLYIVVRLRPPK
jgi:hypothetical protein